MSAFPATIAMKECVLIYDQPVIVDFGISGRRQSRINSGHLWRIKAEFPMMTRAQAAPLIGFSNANRGKYTTFTIIPTNTATPQGLATGTPEVFGVVAAGEKQIPVDGLPVFQAGIMKSGDVVKFAGHNKVYMLTADVDSDFGGSDYFYITPPLVAALADNESVVLTNVPFTVAIDDDLIEWKSIQPEHSSYSISFVESL